MEKGERLREENCKQQDKQEKNNAKKEEEEEEKEEKEEKVPGFRFGSTQRILTAPNT